MAHCAAAGGNQSRQKGEVAFRATAWPLGCWGPVARCPGRLGGRRGRSWQAPHCSRAPAAAACTPLLGSGRGQSITVKVQKPRIFFERKQDF